MRIGRPHVRSVAVVDSAGSVGSSGSRRVIEIVAATWSPWSPWCLGPRTARTTWISGAPIVVAAGPLFGVVIAGRDEPGHTVFDLDLPCAGMDCVVVM
ncbi:hypothetical protein ACFFX0_03415 [Citricoccus parietis]|uniref:GAF domain-containing protein n=1 Tax=Citricoccus parietis TaxID=592307 RepID=A0ABV5FUE1_9MICC